jgi:dehydrogenase/reductase SDR family protein 4
MKGRVAIITASSTGIGRAVAERLAEEGCKVVVSSRNKEHVDHAVVELRGKGFEALGVVCHVGKKEDLKRLVEKTY